MEIPFGTSEVDQMAIAVCLNPPLVVMLVACHCLTTARGKKNPDLLALTPGCGKMAELGTSRFDWEVDAMKSKETRRNFLAVATKATGTAAGVVAVGANGIAKETKASKKVITRPGQKLAPTALFSPATQFGNVVYVSGQTAHDPATGKLVSGIFQDQVRQCLENLKAVVEASGSSMDQVLKCTVFLTDIANFQAMNEVYHTYFPSNPPARSTVAVRDLAGGTPVEIDCFAHTS